MMEQNRFRLDLSNKSLREIKVHNDEQININRQSLEVILESIVTTIGFVIMLIK